MEVIFRRACEDDAGEVLDVVKRCSDETPFMSSDSSERPDDVRLQARAIAATNAVPSGGFFVCVADGRIVGVLGLHGDNRRRVVHRVTLGINILASHCGMGLGRFMMEKGLEYARGTGVTRKVDLYVRTDNYRAIALYEKLGFRVEGEMSRHFVVEGEFFSVYVMGLEI